MVGVLGIPFDDHSSFMQGPAKAPAAIRAAFHSPSANYYTESLTNLHQHPGWKDLGDVSFPNGASPFNTIRDSVSTALSSCEKLLMFGGDHSVSYPIVDAYSRVYKRLNILHIDAHPDLYHDFEGNPYSHASPFARIMENGLAARLVQVGIRTLTQHQKEQAQKLGVEQIQMKDFTEDLRFVFDGPVYISVDLDALDPAFAPGLSHYEPGGMSTRQLLSLISHVQGQVVGADIVELNPDRDVHDVTAMTAAKVFKELLDILLRK